MKNEEKDITTNLMIKTVILYIIPFLILIMINLYLFFSGLTFLLGCGGVILIFVLGKE
jgi:hypothetical protein